MTYFYEVGFSVFLAIFALFVQSAFAFRSTSSDG